jgi:hypothetical protein
MHVCMYVIYKLYIYMYMGVCIYVLKRSLKLELTRACDMLMHIAYRHVCVCVYVCMYVFMYLWIYVSKYVCLYVCLHVRMYVNE